LVHPGGVIWVIPFYHAVWFQVSGVSPAAGLKNGQFDRERNFLVLYEICRGRIYLVPDIVLVLVLVLVLDAVVLFSISRTRTRTRTIKHV
jgi:hypothetical protein